MKQQNANYTGDGLLSLFFSENLLSSGGRLAAARAMGWGMEAEPRPCGPRRGSALHAGREVSGARRGISRGMGREGDGLGVALPSNTEYS